MILHALDPAEVLAADVARGEGEGVVLVGALVDDEVIVLRERPLAKSTFKVFNGRATLPASTGGSNSLEAF